MNTKIIKFDLNKNLYDTLIAKQGDTKSRFLLFNLLDGSIPFSLENRSVRVYAIKPDKTEVFNDLIITDAAKGYCVLELTTQMLAVSGTIKLELMVIEGDKKLTSNIFYMDVKESINSEKAIVSTNEFGALLTALASLNEYDNYKNEIKNARGGQVNLKTRLDNFDEHLDNVANKGTTVEVLERVTKEEIDRQIADGTIANLTIEDNSILNEKIKRGTITLDKQEWLNVKKLNIVNPATIIPGKYIGPNGDLLDSPSGSLQCTDYTIVEGGNSYYSSTARVSAFYDKDKKYISTLPNNHENPFIAPVGAKYIRKTFGVNEIKLICEGSELINVNAKYEDIELSAKSKDFENLIIKIANDNFTLKEGSILLEHESWINIKTLNLFNVDTATKGYLNVNGDVFESPSGALIYSDYIEVKEGNEYYNSNTRVICFYDKNKKYVSGLNTNSYTNPFTVPAGVKYLRIVYNISDKKVLCEGNTLIDENASYGDTKACWNNTLLENLIKETANVKILVTQGKNMLVFGDSITATAQMNDDGSEYKEVSTNWPTYTKQSLQVGSFKNIARAGATFRYRSDVEYRQTISNQVQLAINNNIPADIIVISAGTNDWEANMGDFNTAMSKATLSDLDLTKTYEAIRWNLWTIREHYPNAICFIATPIQRADVEPFYKIIEAICKMAERYNFIIIPAHSESGIIRDFETQGKAGRYLYDGLHPGDKGKQLMSKLYTRVILNSLENFI